MASFDAQDTIGQQCGTGWTEQNPFGYSMAGLDCECRAVIPFRSGQCPFCRDYMKISETILKNSPFRVSKHKHSIHLPGTMDAKCKIILAITECYIPST